MELEEYLEGVKKELKNKGFFILEIKANPNSRQTVFMELLNFPGKKIVKMNIQAVPEKGKANKVIEKFCANYFKCLVEILQGGTNSYKKIKLEMQK